MLRPEQRERMVIREPDLSQKARTRRARSGGRILVDQLLIHGTKLVTCVPGESYLPALEALYEVRNELQLIVCRHEGGAAYMAEAVGKLTGAPGVCFVTRGPGATNASIGVHTAFQNSSPMLLLIGQVPREHRERQAFQELDYREMFRGMAKWVAEVDDPRRLPEFVARAFQLAVSGRPGPVVLAIPEDVFSEVCEVEDAERYKIVQPHPGETDFALLHERLSAASRPVAIVGGSGWTKQAVSDLLGFVEANKLPVATSFRRQDLVDNRAQCYVGSLGVNGTPTLPDRIREADLVILIGTRPDAVTSASYSLLHVPRPHQRLVHVHADTAELGRVYQADLPINAGPQQFAAAARRLVPVKQMRWRQWTEKLRGEFLAYQKPHQGDDALDLGATMEHLKKRLPADAILTNGAGNYTVWPQRYYEFSTYPSQLGPQVGSMGYSIPAALAAKALYPERLVVAFAGDGCFLMNGQELATAMRHGLDILVLVFNNGMYGTIRTHQEQRYPGHAYGTDLTNPDFAAYARAFGAHGEVVERTDEFLGALERAMAATGPALIDLRMAKSHDFWKRQ